MYKGGGSYFISSILKDMSLRNVNYHCVDTFGGHDKKDLIDTNDVHLPSWFSDTSFNDVKSYLSCFDFVQVVKGRIQDCSLLFDDKKIHFVHLDVDLYNPVLFSLNLFSAKLQCGGIMVVDDFGFITCPGVRKAVDQFMENHSGSFHKFELSTGQCLLIKISL